LGDPVLDIAPRGHRLAEGHAGRGPGAHQLERTLGRPDGPHAVVYAARSQAGLGDHEALALARDEVLGGHADVLEDDLGVSLLVLVTEDGQTAHHLDATGVEGYEDHALLMVKRRLEAGLAHHDHDPAGGW